MDETNLSPVAGGAGAVAGGAAIGAADFINFVIDDDQYGALGLGILAVGSRRLCGKIPLLSGFIRNVRRLLAQFGERNV
ncbi:MAG: hypothetical protein ABSE22_02565 [Xanthobacteraceae bacterium]|jgi:hypothetical protein